MFKLINIKEKKYYCVTQVHKASTKEHDRGGSGANSLILCNEYLGTLNFSSIFKKSSYFMTSKLTKKTIGDIGPLNLVKYAKL